MTFKLVEEDKLSLTTLSNQELLGVVDMGLKWVHISQSLTETELHY